MHISNHLSNTDIDNIISIIKITVPNVHGIYLFGSYAQGVPHKSSDVDIAFFAEKPLNVEELFELSLKLASKLKKDVDCIDLKATNTVLAMQVVSTGRLIYCSDKTKVNFFEMTIFSMYAKLNEERSEIIEDVLKRGSIYGR